MFRSSLPLVIAIALALGGCSSTPATPPSQTTASNDTINAELQHLNEAKQQIHQLQSEFDKKENQDLTYFAPKPLKKAAELLDEAEQEYQDAINGDYSMLSVFNSAEENAIAAKQEITQLIAKGTASFKQAVAIKQTANSILADAFALRRYLRKIEAKQYFARDYTKYSRKIDKLVSRIASGDEKRAMREQPALIADLTALEIKTMLHIKLSRVNQTIEELRRKNSDDRLPQVYFELKQIRDKATVTIKTTPRDIAKIDTQVAAVKFQIKRLNQLMRQYSQLKKLRSSHYEKYLLKQENQFFLVSQALAEKDFRDLSFSQQTSENLKGIETLKQQIAQLSLAQLSSSDNNDAQRADQAIAQNEELNSELQAVKTENTNLKNKIQRLQETLANLIIQNEARPKPVLGLDKVMEQATPSSVQTTETAVPNQPPT